MPVRKEIIYPVFLECCQYVDDIFWENIFEDLAYGKTPNGTYISKDFLCCNYKKKEFTYKIEKKDSKVIYEEVYKLLTNKLELFSQREKVKNRKAFNDAEETIKETRKYWNDIRKKNTKELLVELYVTRMKIKHSLSIQQSRFLLSIIILALVFKVITNDDIDYRDGHIYNISGIDFDKKQVIFKRDLYNLEVSFSPNIIVDKKSMSDCWDKYLKDLRKLIEK